MTLYRKQALIPTYYLTYTDKVSYDEPLDALRAGGADTAAFFEDLSKAEWDYRYAPGKWNLREVLLHIIDCERVFGYRALHIARGDQSPLPGMDQNIYADHSEAARRSPISLIAEYYTVRASTLALFESMSETQWLREGTANAVAFNPLSLAFIIAGHEIHHVEIAKERYL